MVFYLGNSKKKANIFHSLVTLQSTNTDLSVALAVSEHVTGKENNCLGGEQKDHFLFHLYSGLSINK